LTAFLDNTAATHETQEELKAARMALATHASTAEASQRELLNELNAVRCERAEALALVAAKCEEQKDTESELATARRHAETSMKAAANAEELAEEAKRTARAAAQAEVDDAIVSFIAQSYITPLCSPLESAVSLTALTHAYIYILSISVSMYTHTGRCSSISTL
jgi:hypothetical protein